MAMPIGFMRINIKSGNGILKENSYKFLPGSSLTIDEGASLTFSDNTNVIFSADYADNYNYYANSRDFNNNKYISGINNPRSYIYNHRMWYAYYNYCIKYNTSTKAFENVTKQTPSVSFGAECIVKGTLVSKGSIGGNIYKYSSGNIAINNKSAKVLNIIKIIYHSGDSGVKIVETMIELNIINK